MEEYFDNTDKEIAKILYENARTSYSDIGKRLGISRTAIKNRIEKLEGKGIVKGYNANINTFALKNLIILVVDIETTEKSYKNVREILMNTNKISGLYATKGCLHAICIVKNSSELSNLKNFLENLDSKENGVVSIKAEVLVDVIKGRIF